MRQNGSESRWKGGEELEGVEGKETIINAHYV